VVWVEEGKMKKIFSAAAMFLSLWMVSTAWAVVPQDVPEPSLLLLLGAGFIGVAGLGRKLKR
jgi:hypothetical protein